MTDLRRRDGTLIASGQGTIRDLAETNGADLRDAHLRDAHLGGAHLQWAHLGGADLKGAHLAGTCLDPAAAPNGDCARFKGSPGWRYGYRTASSPVMGGPGYVVGHLYEAPVFSVARTECHPGLYVCPTIDGAKARGAGPIVRVRFRAPDCHSAGDKWRVRRFAVIEEVEP